MGGELVLPRETLHAAGPAPFIVSATCHGYYPEEVALGQNECAASLVMHPAGTLRVDCATEDGKPLAGVRLTVSKTALPHGDFSLGEFHPEASLLSKARFSIAQAVSGVDGVATFSGVPQGKSYLVAMHKACVLVDGLPNKAGPIDIGDSTHVRLVFSPIVCAFAVIDDDRLLQCGGRMPKSVRMPPYLFDRLTWVYDQLRKSGGPEALILVAVAKFENGQYCSLSESVTFQVFCERHGVREATVSMRRLDEYARPDRMVLGQAPPASTAEVKLCLRTPSGREIEPHGVSLYPISDGRGILRIPLSSSAAKRLPTGDYGVACSQPWLAKEIGMVSLKVARDETLVVNVSRELCVFRINGKYYNGMPIDAGRVVFSWSDQENSSLFTVGLAKTTWILPTGALAISLTLPGGHVLSHAVTVPVTSDMWTWELGTIE